MTNTLVCLSALAALAFQAASGKALSFPKPTVSLVLPLDGITPRPTLGPGQDELRKRQSAAETVLVAPDNTCGYVSGRPGAAYTCAAGGQCVFFTSTATLPGAVACCNSNTCNLRAACLDAAAVSVSSLCDSGCQV